VSDFDYDIYLKDPDRANGFKNKKVRTLMPREQRAKQFAPFDALSGLTARLKRAEIEHREEMESKGVVHVDAEESI